jgi:hypothetical protein
MLFAITSLTLAAAVSAPSTGGTLTQQAELMLGSAVIDRKPQPLPEILVAGQTLYAVTQITGPGGGFVEHVWSCNGKELAHHYLPIGQSKRWRTWSRHKVVAGKYHLEVLGQDGSQLREADFEVVPADAD